MPKDGYTVLIEKILDHPGIKLSLGTEYDHSRDTGFEHVFYSGQIDAYFGYGHGMLGYRTLDFESFIADGDYQGNADTITAPRIYHIPGFRNTNIPRPRQVSIAPSATGNTVATTGRVTFLLPSETG